MRVVIRDIITEVKEQLYPPEHLKNLKVKQSLNRVYCEMLSLCEIIPLDL